MKKSVNRKETKTIGVRFSMDEVESINYRADDLSMSVSEYIRMLVQKDMYPEYKTEKEIIMDRLSSMQDEVIAAIKENTPEDSYKIPDLVKPMKGLDGPKPLERKRNREIGDLSSEGSGGVSGIIATTPGDFPKRGRSLLDG